MLGSDAGALGGHVGAVRGHAGPVRGHAGQCWSSERARQAMSELSKTLVSFVPASCSVSFLLASC